MSAPRSDFHRALDRIGKGKHVSLTTFRRNGQPVPTPVGSLVHDGILYALTPPDTGKAKRIRGNPQVTIAPCDMKGTVPADAPTVSATARLLDRRTPGTGAGSRHLPLTRPLSGRDSWIPHPCSPPAWAVCHGMRRTTVCSAGQAQVA
ncbi:PPOX class F420-dependent oxidoreductase [Streptomyces phaeochromogenes]